MNATTEALVKLGNTTGSTTYAPTIIMERGEGMEVWDSEGNRYLDFLAGIAVNALGHCHPRVVQAVQEQAGRMMQISNVFFSRPQIRLQELLTAHSFADRVFLCSSGAEANEGAMKLARRYQRVTKGETQRVEIIAFERSFHGRTLAAIAATGQPKYQHGFEPLPPGFVHARFNDLASVEALIGPQTTAVLVEPIQGEGGIIPATPEFLQGLRDLCDKHGALLIFDEVQAGIGRTGDLFAYQTYGVTPDIITLAKGLGGGVPIGAFLSTNAIFAAFERGSHATTFGGNPVCAAASVAVLETVLEPGRLEHARAMGALLREQLEALSGIREVRGVGLMLGVDVGAELAPKLVVAARERGLLVNTAGYETVRLVPPLTVEPEHITRCVAILQDALNAVGA